MGVIISVNFLFSLEENTDLRAFLSVFSYFRSSLFGLFIKRI